ncbi:TIGR00730 family Rossman fold protein [Halarcobacter sp.]|uniref:LOG family protein n=1 Tax=Halarcobacter sp. TaxID=2321133 RepID=UPI0029F5087E|nr:TIGR00730 family Rossman fold protein [Halarcobacter sp.]
MNVAIYCGTAFGESPIYKEKTIELINYLNEKDSKIVYGGSKVGLMGVVSNHAMSLGMDVYGVITHGLANKELENENITKLYKVETIRERKAMMEDLADSFIAMPGGFGTLEEITEIFTTIQIGNSKKPCALYNVNGYYDKFIEYLNFCENEGFLLKEHLDSIIVSDDIEYIYKCFENYTPPKNKWDILKV